LDTVEAFVQSEPAVSIQSRISVRNLRKSYRLGDEVIDVLRDLSLELVAGEMVAIMGPSGAGKTTLLNCLSAIDKPDSGDIAMSGKLVNFESQKARTLLRRQDLGIVFQFFNLVPTLTVRENVALPIMIAGRQGPDTQRDIDEILDQTGLQARANHLPNQLSGGEMQLTSIARALVHRPVALLADEPTGNVNPVVGRSIMETLRKSARAQNTAILLVTHSVEHAAWADRVCFLKDGHIAGECRHGGDTVNVRPVHEKLLALGI
jgi:putative ABC transport system ATP-binding protein